MESTLFAKQFQWCLALYGENPTPEIVATVLRLVTKMCIVELQCGRGAATRAEDAFKLVEDAQVHYERHYEAERKRSLQAASARDELTITVKDLQSLLEDADRDKAEALDRLQDLQEERGHCQAELLETRAELMTRTEALQQCQDELRVVSMARDVNRAEVREHGTTITMLSDVLQARENYIIVLQRELSAACAELVELEHSSHQVTEQLKARLEMEQRGRADLYARWKDCETRLEQRGEDLSRMQTALVELHVQAGEQENQMQSLDTQLQLCQRRLAEAVSARDESDARAQKSEEEVSRLTHQTEVLEQEHEGTVSHLEAELDGTQAQCRQLKNELSCLSLLGAASVPHLHTVEEKVYPVLLEPEAVLASECDWAPRKMETPQHTTPTNQGAIREETSSHLPGGSVSDCPERQASSWSPEEMHHLGIALGWDHFACLGGGHLQKQKLGTVNVDWVLILGLQGQTGGREMWEVDPVCLLMDIFLKKAGLSDFLQDCAHLWRGTDSYNMHCSSTPPDTELLLAQWTREAICLLPRDYGPLIRGTLQRPPEPPMVHLDGTRNKREKLISGNQSVRIWVP